MNPVISKNNKISWKFENVKELDENGMFSDVFKIGDTNWNIFIKSEIEKKSNLKYLGIYLHYASENKKEDNWICQTERTIKLINQNATKNEMLTAVSCFLKAHGWGCRKYYEWDKLIGDGFMKDNAIVVEIDFSFELYDFSKNIPNYTDITLKVGNTDFFINKGVLCSKSEYFYDIFVNQKCTDKMMDIKDVDTEDFRFFIAFFYPMFDYVRESNYKQLIDLAHRFKVKFIHKKCEEFLISSNTIKFVEKIQISDENGYDKLLRDTLEKAGNELKLFPKSMEFEKLKESTKNQILLEILDR